MALTAPLQTAAGEKVDNWSRSQLLGKTGEIAVALQTKRLVGYMRKLGQTSWKTCQSVLQRVATPLGCFESLIGDGDTQHSLPDKVFTKTQQEMASAPQSVRIAITIIKKLLSRDGEYLQKVKAVLMHKAVEEEAKFLQEYCSELWSDLLAALKVEEALPDELRDKEPPTQPAVETAGSKEDDAGKEGTSDAADTAQSQSDLAVQAGKRADEIMSIDPGSLSGSVRPVWAPTPFWIPRCTHRFPLSRPGFRRRPGGRWDGPRWDPGRWQVW